MRHENALQISRCKPVERGRGDVCRSGRRCADHGAFIAAQCSGTSIETVQWRRDWRGWGWGPGVVAGAIVGGAIAAAQPWNWGYYDAYAYAPGYSYCYAPGYAYTPGYSYAPGEAYGDYAYAPGPGYSVGYSGGSDAAYCSQRFRSYDPGSGTYLGYDGMRHPCP
jgi:hypothetical protein